MESPWADADSIRSTQTALAFILKNRAVFEALPSGYSISSVENYLHGILPIVIPDSTAGFTLGAYSLWATEEQYYFKILRGVLLTGKLIHKLRQFVDQFEFVLSDGELRPLIEEMKTLLANHHLSQAPTDLTGFTLLKVWRVLRLDRNFRIHVPDTLSRLLSIVYEIDVLVSMADFTNQQGFVFPGIDEGALSVRAEGLVHPYLNHAVPNSLNLDYKHRRLFLTGPNMAGKTTYLRAFATSLYLAHLGIGVPAKSYSFVPVERLYSSISISDNLHSGVSYFRAEALRVKQVAQAIVEGYRVVTIMDEPFKGTNVKDTFEALSAILERFASRANCLFMFSSHQIELGEKLSDVGYPIDCRCFTAVETEDRLRFDFLLRAGVSKQRIGMRVLSEEGVFDLLDGKGIIGS